jgi:hypothetical protein
LDDGDLFDDTLVIGALRTDGAFHIGRPVHKTLTAGSVPPVPSLDDDFDRRMTLPRHRTVKPLTAQPVIDVAPALGEPAPVAVDEDEAIAPLDPPPAVPEWQEIWRAYRKGDLTLSDFLARFRRKEVPMDFHEGRASGRRPALPRRVEGGRIETVIRLRFPPALLGLRLPPGARGRRRARRQSAALRLEPRIRRGKTRPLGPLLRTGTPSGAI